MHILITGSAGFLGFHVARHFLENGAKVTLVDRFSDYYSTELKFLRAQHLRNAFREETLNIDLARNDEVFQLRDKNFTHIVTELTYMCGAGNSELGYFHSRSGADREKCQNNLEVTQMIEGF